MRNITVYASSGKSGQVFQTEATKLGDIMNNLRELNISTENMRLITDSEIELLGNESQLPDGDFILFLMQKKSKAGAKAPKPSRKDINAAIQQAIASGTATKADFAVGDKNYTQVPSDTLLEILTSKGISVSIPGEVSPEFPVQPVKSVEKKEEAPKSAAPAVPVSANVAAVATKTTTVVDHKETLQDILLDLAGVVVPAASQKAFNLHCEGLAAIVTSWENPKPFVDNNELERKAREIRNKFSGLA